MVFDLTSYVTVYCCIYQLKTVNTLIFINYDPYSYCIWLIGAILVCASNRWSLLTEEIVVHLKQSSEFWLNLKQCLWFEHCFKYRAQNIQSNQFFILYIWNNVSRSHENHDGLPSFLSPIQLYSNKYMYNIKILAA